VAGRARRSPQAVGKVAGIAFPGVQITERFLLAGVYADLPVARDRGIALRIPQLVGSPGGFLTAVVLVLLWIGNGWLLGWNETWRL
jgi:hypothetical protein